MAETRKEAERRRLAAALRENLKRRKVGARPPARPGDAATDDRAEPPRADGERG